MPEPPAAPLLGGQAVSEGVMIRGQHHVAVAVRSPLGDILVRDAELAAVAPAWRRMPIVRGLVVLAESMSVGIRALRWSIDVAGGDRIGDLGRPRVPYVPMVLLGATIFCLPVLLTFWLGWVFNEWVGVVAEGFVRLFLLVGYVAVIGVVPEFARLFSYHAAEHRAIHAWEQGRPLTVEEVRAFPNAHARCGTAFLLTLVVVAGVGFLFLGTPPLLLRLLERLLLAPVIAGVSYELLRLSHRYEGSAAVRMLFRPNLWMQRLTTRDPDSTQIEVAIVALERAIELEALSVDDARVAAEPLS